MMKELKKVNFLPKWLLAVVAIFLAVIIIFGGVMLVYGVNYKNKIFYGVKIGALDLAGKTKEQAQVLIQAKIDKLINKGVEFSYHDKRFVIEPIVSTGSEAGLAYELWQYNPEEIATELFNMGRGGGWWLNMGERIRLFVLGTTGRVEYKLKEDGVRRELEKYFSQFESPTKEAALVWRSGRFEVAEEESGLVFNYSQAIGLLKKDLEIIGNKPIGLNLIIDEPKVKKSEAEFLKKEAREVLKLAPLTIFFKIPDYYQGRKRFKYTEWYVNKKQLREWLKIKKGEQKGVYLGIDDEAVGEFLQKIKKEVDTPAKDAKFEIKNGRVIEWQSSSDGFVVNSKETINQIEKKLIEDNLNKIKLVLSVDKSKITNDNVNDLGIRELIGMGESDFSGSPSNRRYNIALGAESLNGLLIKPDEEFSLLEALGEIDAKAGYKPELVIKEGETVPEYGGGLCQIGTTMFRLVINSGLPITQRRNHSYRVGYYEPAGTDATIYDPWPDFKFINDSGSYLLLQTRIEGDSLIFEFWGTGDGRVVETTEPVIYNIVKPGEPKEIFTDKLKPGEKKRTERAHNGADAYFKRTISWPKEKDKEKIEETWSSHYVPWQEVWLVGATSTAAEVVK